MRSRSLVSARHVAVAWLLVVAACDTPADSPALPDGVSFLERDSGGVSLATTLGPRARAPIGWVVDPVQEYEVGSAEGEEPYLFTRITGARQLPDGRVVVLERTTCDLRFFGPDGGFLGRAGGFGEGPGEFSGSCFWVDSPGDEHSVLVYDGVRLSFFDDRGRYDHRVLVARASPRSGYRVTRVHGVVRDRALVEYRFFSVWEAGYPREPSTSDFALLELGTWRAVREDFFQGSQLYRHPSHVGTSVLWDIPFDIRPSSVLGEDGFFLTVGEDRGPEILEYGLSGDLRRIIRLAELSVEASPEHLDRYIEFHVADIWEQYRERAVEQRRSIYQQVPLPEIIPVFSRLLIDEAGLLWAELYRYDVRRPPRWLVFGPNGEGLGSVDLPPDLNALQIGRDFVLGVWEDELEVQYVRRHALHGRG